MNAKQKSIKRQYEKRQNEILTVVSRDQPDKATKSGLPSASEYGLSVAYYAWFGWCYPRSLEVLFHVPNERMGAAIRVKLSKIGVKSGISDYILLEPRGDFCGFCLELKTKKNRKGLTESQRLFLRATAKRGYFSWCAKGLDDAQQVTKEYMDLEPSFNA